MPKESDHQEDVNILVKDSSTSSSGSFAPEAFNSQNASIKDPDYPLVGPTAYVVGWFIGAAYFWTQHNQFTDMIENLSNCKYDFQNAIYFMVFTDVLFLSQGVLQVNVSWNRLGVQTLIDYFKNYRTHSCFSSACLCCKREKTPDQEPLLQVDSSALNVADEPLNKSGSDNELGNESALLLTEPAVQDEQHEKSFHDGTAHHIPCGYRTALLTVALLTIVSGIGVSLRDVSTGDNICPTSVLPFELDDDYHLIMKLILPGIAGALMNLASMTANYKQYKAGVFKLENLKKLSPSQVVLLAASTVTAAFAYLLINIGTCEQLDQKFHLVEKSKWAYLLYGLLTLASVLVNAGLYFLNTYKSITAYNHRKELCAVSGDKKLEPASGFRLFFSEIKKDKAGTENILQNSKKRIGWKIFISLVNAFPLFMSTLEHGCSTVGADSGRWFSSGKWGAVFFFGALPLLLQRAVLTMNAMTPEDPNVSAGLQIVSTYGSLDFNRVLSDRGFERRTPEQHFPRVLVRAFSL